ncbi:MAG: radical SAM protein [Methanotrichaceae archaeon]|nr:radical SAM protein [Methanotrichaceae archaeon]
MDFVDQSYMLVDSPLIKAKAAFENGRIKVSSFGLLSMLPYIRSAVEMIDGQIPAKVNEKLFLSTWLPPAPSQAFDRFVESQIKSMVHNRTPDQVTISITEECPNKCVHCALPDSGQGLRLEANLIKDIISQILDLGTTLIIFDGGEPTLYRGLPQLVQAVDNRAISTLFTSGAGFIESLAYELKDSGLYAINVSIDSPVPEEHDTIRGRKGAFRDAMKAVEFALEADLLVDIYVVLRHQNIHQLHLFHELARNIGAHELTFFEVVPTGRFSGKKDVLLSEGDYDALQEFVSCAPPPRIFSVPSALKRFGCFGGRSWMHITPAGDVYPCACFPLSFGNIHHEPVRSIWRRMGEHPFKGSKICPMRNQ